MIRLLLAALFLSLAGAGAVHADTRDVYTIRGIPVDETAATVIEARERAMSSARLTAARTLINKITLASDRAAAGGVPVDTALAARFAAAVDVEEEAQGAGRYRGKLAVVLNPAVVRAHLDSLKVPYLDAQAPLVAVDLLAHASGRVVAQAQVFDLEHVGAQVGQMQGAHGAGQ